MEALRYNAPVPFVNAEWTPCNPKTMRLVPSNQPVMLQHPDIRQNINDRPAIKQLPFTTPRAAAMLAASVMAGAMVGAMAIMLLVLVLVLERGSHDRTRDRADDAMAKLVATDPAGCRTTQRAHQASVAFGLRVRVC